MAIIRILIGFIAAVAIAAAAGSVLQTQMVIGRFPADVPLSTRLSMTWGDLVGLGPQYASVLAIGFAIAFLVAALLRRVLKPLAPLAYPLAGAAAVGAALLLMPIALDLPGLTPLAGTRDGLGFLLQCLAGAAGGVIFDMLARRRA
jgi:hypothetical protein